MKQEDRKGSIVTIIGISVMVLLTVTKAVPSSNIAGYSVLAGIAFFFVTEAVSKTPDELSGLRFKTIAADIRKPGVILWMLLPCMSGILTLIAGNLLFGGAFTDHVLSRTGDIAAFDKTALLVFQIILAALGGGGDSIQGILPRKGYEDIALPALCSHIIPYLCIRPYIPGEHMAGSL